MARRFANLDPRHRPQDLAAVLRWGVLDPLRGRRRPAPPGPPAPRVAADVAALARREPGLRLTWLGHSSFLVDLQGRLLLVDPVLSHRVGGFYRRYQEPAFGPERLPPVDLVLVSHNHYDHLDAPTLRFIGRDVPVVVPLGLGPWFRRRGHRRVEELGWWQELPVAGLEVALVPARHWSRRRVGDTNRSWWGGFVVRAGDLGFYHAGDSAWFPGFAEIGRRYPGLEVAALPVGGYDPPWFMEKNHLNPEQAGEAFLDLGARRLVPMHWGTFRLTDEPLVEPVARLERWWRRHGPGDGRRLEVLAVGESLEVAVRVLPRAAEESAR